MDCLPYEGDHTLAVILSKAMIPAQDTKITDPTILSRLQPYGSYAPTGGCGSACGTAARTHHRVDRDP